VPGIDALGRLEAKVSEEEADAAGCCQLDARRDHLPRIKVEHDTPCAPIKKKSSAFHFGLIE